MFTKEFLSGVRRMALRRRVFFKALDGVERGILSISAKIIDSVKSGVLMIQLVKIISKLRDACKSDFVRHLERYGMERVRVVQSQAAGFGYRGADKLIGDFGFVRYLVFLDFNQPLGWRSPRA